MNKLAFALSLACLFAPAWASAQNAYISNGASATVSVIDTTTNMVVGTPIPVGNTAFGVAVTLDGSKVYVTNQDDHTVSVIDTATNMVVGTPIPVGNGPRGVAITPDGSKVFVANSASTTASVIDTANNTVVATILGLNVPSAWRSPPTAARSMSPI
jgi:YVTN family beta-propeller protein